MNLKQSLHSLLADSETAEVIEQLRSITEGALTGLNAEVEQISTRFQENIEKSHHELSDEGAINRENSSIRYALFAVINRLPEDAVLPEAQRAKRLKIALFMIAAVTIFAIVAFNFGRFKLERLPANTPAPNVAMPIVESSQTPRARITPPVTPVVPMNVSKIVANTPLKVDSLPKKKVRRVKKIPPVILGDTFKIN